MKLLQSNKSKIIAIVVFIALGLFSAKLFAQEKDALREKLDNLKGKVDKVTLKVDGKDVVFEGKDAEKLYEKLQQKKMKHLSWVSEDDMEDCPGGEVSVYLNSDEDMPAGAMEVQKKIKIEDKDGKKTVTITTTKDGKEDVKVLEGQEAEKFMKENQAGKHIKVMVDGDEDASGDNMIYFNRQLKHSGGCGCCCCCGGERMPRHMNMRNDKGEKKVIIKHLDQDDKDLKEKTEKK
jgi:hypothetical protein